MPPPSTDANVAVSDRSEASVHGEATPRVGSRPLMIVDTIEVGGAGKVVLQSARGLGARGTPVSVANFRYRGRPSAFDGAARAGGAEVVALEQAHRGDWSCIASLVRYARARRIDLIESHSFKAHLVGWRVAAQLRVPWLAWAHGWTAESRRVRVYNLVERRLLRRADHVCAVAPSIATALRRAGRRGPITVLANALDPAPRPPTPAERAAARAALGIGRDSVVVATLGRLSREKGVDVLLEAIARIVPAHPSLRVVVAGDGPEGEVLRRRSRAPDLCGRIAWLGARADVGDLYAAADAVAIPSRSEGLPNVALEAADAAVPLIATRVGALPDVVGTGGGWLVPPDDAASLADAIGAAVVADDRRERGAQLRAHVLANYSAARRIDALVALHRHVVGVGPS